MRRITMAMNRAAYRAALDDVSGDLQKVADAIASCEAGPRRPGGQASRSAYSAESSRRDQGTLRSLPGIDLGP